MGKKLDCNEKYLIHLLKSSVLNEIPKEKPNNVSFEKIFSLGKYHNVANICYYSISKLKNKPDEKLLFAWKEIKEKAVVKNIIQKNELNSILNIFNKNKIFNVILKGFELKKLYPSEDMRLMTDIDILVKKSDTQRVYNIMKSLKYEVKSFGKGKDDIYFKPPVMNVEIHNSLFDKTYEEFDKYFQKLSNMENIKIKNLFECTFTDEDFFLFLFIHNVKHYMTSGIGVRAVLDIWLYIQEKKQSLDWNYIFSTLEKLKLKSFYFNFTHLGEVWFGTEKENDIDVEIGKYIFSSGTYGNSKNNNLNNILNKNNKTFLGKIIAIYSLCFPKLYNLEESYPVLRKYPFLLIFCYIHRGIKKIFFDRKKFKQVKEILDGDRKSIDYLKTLHKKSGLK